MKVRKQIEALFEELLKEYIEAQEIVNSEYPTGDYSLDEDFDTMMAKVGDYRIRLNEILSKKIWVKEV